MLASNAVFLQSMTCYFQLKLVESFKISMGFLFLFIEQVISLTLPYFPSSTYMWLGAHAIIQETIGRCGGQIQRCFA